MFINELPQSKVIDLKNELKVQSEKMSSLFLVKREDLNLVLFALDKGKEIGGHSSSGDAMVNILSGIAKVKIEDEEYEVKAGETLIIPANLKHSLYAIEAFQMLLVNVKASK